jgi:hypothetical protein
MGLPITPVITNIYMESFEQQAICLVAKKLAHWYRYADDTFVIWTHGRKSFKISFTILTVSILIASSLWKWNRTGH